MAGSKGKALLRGAEGLSCLPAEHVSWGRGPGTSAEARGNCQIADYLLPQYGRPNGVPLV